MADASNPRNINPHDWNREDLILEWREDPVLAAREIFNVKLDHHQRIVLRQRWTSSSTIDILSRGTGKTFLDGLFCGLRGVLYPGNRVGIIAPSYRQSKLVFAEIEKLYNRSPLFQEAVKKYARTPECCYFNFHNAPGKNASYIAALPIGTDGSKIRGERFFDLVADEAAQIDNDTLNIVARGFLATSNDPMERVAFMQEQREKIRLGLMKEEDLINPEQNKLILSSTAYYQYNHLWGRVQTMMEVIQKGYKEALRTGDQKELAKYKLMGGSPNGGQIPYRVMSNGELTLSAFTYMDPSEGFMNMKSIEDSRRDMSEYMFKMEYECFTGDTEVLTDRGVKPISEVRVGDFVLTHRGRFRRVTGVIRHNYSGPMVGYLAYGYNRMVKVTANHPLWDGGESWQNADEQRDELFVPDLRVLSGRETIDLADHARSYLRSVVNGVEYLYPKPSQAKKDAVGSHHFKSSVQRLIRLDEQFGVVVGYYAAEGSCGAKGKQVAFSLDGHEGLPVEQMVDELVLAIQTSLGRVPNVYRNGSVANVTLNSRLLVELFGSICPGVAESKYVLPEILYSNPAFLRGFLRGYWHGDGNIHGKPQASAASVSRNLVAQVRVALSYFGFPASLRDANGHRTMLAMGRLRKCLPTHAVELKGDNCRRFAEWLDGTMLPPTTHNCGHEYISHVENLNKLQIRERVDFHYEGEVFNLEVEEDHSYVVPATGAHNCFFPPDSEGFFRKQLLDGCRKHGEFSCQLEPRKGMLYAMGVDPARHSDNFAVAIFEIDLSNRMIHLVRVLTWNNKSFPEMHHNIRKLIRLYDIKCIEMDAGGGGTTIRDLLADKLSCPPGDQLILEKENEAHMPLLGKKILEPLFQFSKADLVHDANHNLLGALQHGQIKIAAIPPAGNEIWTQEKEDADEEIEKTILEMSSIVKSVVGNRERWDTPTKTQRKDRYSAVLMGFQAAKKVLDRFAQPQSLAIGFFG